MSQLSVLVLGAGELGTAVLEGLSRHPYRKTATITVLLRQKTINTQDNAKKANVDHLRALGIQFLVGDVVDNKEEELASLFKNFDTIIGCTGMAAESGIQIKLTRAILVAKVPRYIPWQFGVDYDVIGPDSSQNLFSEQLEVRALLRGQCTTSWIIISTGMFMSFLFEDYFGVVSADRKIVRALGSWENRVTVTTVEDIGLMTAEVVFAAPEMKNQVVFIAGDTVSYSQLANTVEQVYHSKLVREEWTVPHLMDMLASDPGNGTKKYRVVFAEGKGVAWDKGKTFDAEKDIELQTVESWLQKQKN